MGWVGLDPKGLVRLGPTGWVELGLGWVGLGPTGVVGLGWVRGIGRRLNVKEPCPLLNPRYIVNEGDSYCMGFLCANIKSHNISNISLSDRRTCQIGRF